MAKQIILVGKEQFWFGVLINTIIFIFLIVIFWSVLKEKDCDDYLSFGPFSAQNELIKHPEDRYDLDRNHDKIACNETIRIYTE